MIILLSPNVKLRLKKCRTTRQTQQVECRGITVRWKGSRQVIRTKDISGKVNRRKEILQAAEKLMLRHGLSGVTTRQISQEVGCSEGALYVHFKGRLELLLAMLEESLPNMLEPRQRLGYLLNRNFSPLIAALLTARAKGRTCR